MFCVFNFYLCAFFDIDSVFFFIFRFFFILFIFILFSGWCVLGGGGSAIVITRTAPAGPLVPPSTKSARYSSVEGAIASVSKSESVRRQKVTRGPYRSSPLVAYGVAKVFF